MNASLNKVRNDDSIASSLSLSLFDAILWREKDEQENDEDSRLSGDQVSPILLKQKERL